MQQRVVTRSAVGSMRRTSGWAAVMVGSAIAVMAGCSTNSAGTSAEPGTSTTITSQESVEGPSIVIDADPAAYEYAADRYRFKLSGTPLRECYIAVDVDPTVSCSVAWPSDTPAVSNGPFSGAPNTIVLKPDGYRPTIDEGGPPGAVLLPENSRIQVGLASCTAVADGVECSNGGDVGFSFVDGELTTRGPVSREEPSLAPSVSASVPAPSSGTDGVYSDGTGPAPLGMACGAATGRRIVEVRSGSISCADALSVMDRYDALPEGTPGEFGNYNIRVFDGWNCATPTGLRVTEQGYSQICSSGDIEIVNPAIR